jgi:DNA primase large subunit
MSNSEELRRRFVKAESALFRVRYDTDDRSEREGFLNSRDFNWIPVSALYQYQRDLSEMLQ